MASSYLSQNYTLDIVWLCVGFIPAIALFAVLAGAKVEELNRSLRKPSQVPARVQRPQSN
ncbi:MAG: hypothetical protein ACXVAF_09385 [Vulcanimicrobiaceae bacterium]